MSKFHVHICTPRNECSMDGYRVNIRTPWKFIIIALNPNARVVKYFNSKPKWIDISDIRNK